jgi:hypothetical protein
MTGRRALLGAAIATASLPLLLAQPASANIPVGGGGGSASGCSGLHCWYAVLTVDIQPIGTSNVAAVAWNCQATADPDAVSTTISTCSVAAHDAPAATLPGPFVSTASATLFNIGDVVDLCVGGQSAFAENAYGNQVVSGYQCQQAIIAWLPV